MTAERCRSSTELHRWFSLEKWREFRRGYSASATKQRRPGAIREAASRGMLALDVCGVADNLLSGWAVSLAATKGPRIAAKFTWNFEASSSTCNRCSSCGWPFASLLSSGQYALQLSSRVSRWIDYAMGFGLRNASHPNVRPHSPSGNCGLGSYRTAMPRSCAGTQLPRLASDATS